MFNINNALYLTWISSESLNEMLGDLFLATETPEAPRQSFFKNLFTGGPSTLDREDLCKCLNLPFIFRGFYSA